MTATGEAAAPRRILLIKPSSLGDVVSAVPVLRGLRRAFPQAHIAWLLSAACAPLLEGDPDLSEIILFDRKRLGRAWRDPLAMGALVKFLWRLRRGRFDWVLDLQGLLRSGIFAWATRAPLRAGFARTRERTGLFYTRRIEEHEEHAVDRNIAMARSLGVEARPDDFRLNVTPVGREFAEAVLKEHGLSDKGFIVCVPMTRWPTKCYPPRRWRSVVARLAETTPVVLIGSPGERAVCQEIAAGLEAAGRIVNLAGETTVPQMVALIARASLVLCGDSAAQYIAPAVGVKVLGLVGPTRPERTGPYRLGRSIVADIPCQGCLKRQCGHVTCMQTIDPAEVARQAAEMLSSADKPE